MPYYEFVSLDGKRTHDIFMEYDDAPDIGAIVQDSGESWRRVASNPQLKIKNFKQFVSHTQPVFEKLEDAHASGIIADKWVPDPDTGEFRAAYTSEETAKTNASASKDAGNLHLVWDD